QRQAIDSFFKEYEVFVTKAEKAADSGKLSDLTKLSLEAVKFTEKIEELEDVDEWTLADSKKYLDLSNRYSKAALKLSESSSNMLDDYSSLLDSYDF
ncbi:MAG: hypothetical protein K5681_10830, partial [Treponema sp.]|nr:hypothetical protein [Treponema sp.]